MLFLKLTVDNLGVFRGKHTFELAPDVENNHNLTIFRGHNGAGKSTLLQAMILALYGEAYFKDLGNSQSYHHFIRNRMHRASSEADPSSNEDFIGVALSLQYVQSGRPIEIQIEREWRKCQHTFKEDLKVLKDGQLIDVDSSDYQIWIDDLIPPGIGLLCFFDAEKLDALASEDQQSKVLGDTIHKLLGLDTVQHLEADLQIFTTRQGSTKKIEVLYARVLETQAERHQLEHQLSALRKQLEEVNSDISSCEAALTQQERRLASEGGIYAARRPVLMGRLQTIQTEIELLSNQLRELCAELLPFTLTPELCLQLSQRLASEIEIRQRQIISKLIEERFAEIEAILSETDSWEGINLPEESRKHIAKLLAKKLRRLGEFQSPDEARIIHHLSELEHQRLSRWIFQSIYDVPKQAQQLGERLRILKEEKQRIDIDLQRVPDEEQLIPIHEEIQRLRSILIQSQKRQTALNEQIGSLQFQYEAKRRQLQEILEQYDKLRMHEKQLRYAEQTKNVLRTYKDTLVRQKLSLLEKTLTEYFNRLCAKEHLLADVHIDPNDLSMQLESINGTILKLNDFSAGERQLYVMALLWALRSVSGFSLPLAIDTPLARLDGRHRSRFIHDYISNVSDQVLLFVTDAEIDNGLLAEAKQHLVRTYQLRYDPQMGETQVSRPDNSVSIDEFVSPLS